MRVEGQPRRSLILAGGGMKVAFQAGVLQVWLDEAGVCFDHVDGASGGTLNLALLCQGRTGTQIADNWRGLPLSEVIDPNWETYWKLAYAESLMKLDRMREEVFQERWQLNWDSIRASAIDATFNVYDFTEQRTRIVQPGGMTEDLLVACISLPMWFPPVRIEGHTYIDAVFNTDANLEEAIRRGADELWVIWTVSQRSQWEDGFVGNYFNIIEAAANGRFNDILRRIEVSNAAHAAGQSAEWDRTISVKVLRAEVPLHYLLNLNADRITEAVERGVSEARRWCLQNKISLKAPSLGPSAASAPISLSFVEEMKGFVAHGATNPEAGYRQGRQERSKLTVHLTIEIDDVERFIAEPDHTATASGWIEGPALGGRQNIDQGCFNLFVDSGPDYDRKWMLYRLFCRDEKGRPLTLSGVKQVDDDHGLEVWHDITTLYTTIFIGHLMVDEEVGAQILAVGIVRIQVLDFLRQLTTFRADSGTGEISRTSALARFGAFFLGSLWDVYGGQLLPASPI
jgi:predicted patatin/cPLA2 family phospholipase